MKKTSGQASPIQATQFPSLDMSKIIKLVENVNSEQLAERELEN